MGTARLLGEQADGRGCVSAHRYRVVCESLDVGAGRDLHDRISGRRHVPLDPAGRAHSDDGAAVDVPAPLGRTLLARRAPSGAAAAPKEEWGLAVIGLTYIVLIGE